MKGLTLTAEQQSALARITEIGMRWTVGSRCDRPRDDVVAELHSVTRDRAVLGVALGIAMGAAELDGWSSYRKLAELYRAAGADEQVAAAELAWHATTAWSTFLRL